MITTQVVNTLYKKYRRLPKGPDFLDMPLLFDTVGEMHGITVDPMEGTLTIASADPMSPFRTIRLDRIHAIIPFEEWTAIVLHSSIIFLNRKNQKIYIHVKPPKMSFWEKLRMRFARG